MIVIALVAMPIMAEPDENTANASVAAPAGWVCENGELTIPSDSGTFTTYATFSGDYTIELTVTVNQTVAGFMFGVQSGEASPCMWQISDGVLRLHYPGWTQIETPSIPVANGTKLTMTIDIKGTTVTTSVDGQQVHTGTVPAGETEGALGIRSALHEVVTYDRLAVIQNGQVIWEDNFDTVDVEKWNFPGSSEPEPETGVLVNDNDSNIIYTSDFIYDPGNPEHMMSDQHYTNGGGSIEYTFNGTGIKWVGQKVFNRGNAEIFIDGESKGIVSQYDGGVLYQQVIWEITDLPAGEHTIKIVNMSDFTCLDAFYVYAASGENENEPETDPVEPEPETGVLVNDNDSNIIYTSDFIYDPGNPEHMMSDQHYTNGGGSIEYTFNGTGIKWVGQKVFNRGNAEIFIDGESKGIVSQYDGGVLYQQVIWEITDLPAGEHTIKIVNMSDFTCLDAFYVYAASGENENEPETDPVEPETNPVESDTDPVTETDTDSETDTVVPPAETDPVTETETDSETDTVVPPAETDPATEPATEADTTSEDTTGGTTGCKSRITLGSFGIMLVAMASGFVVLVNRRKVL